MSLVKVENIFAGYRKENIIENISFEISAGEMVGVLGANGSGKTTLAKAICGILNCNGSVTIDNQCSSELRIKEIAKLISYIPQRSGISIDISVIDVVMMGFNSKLKILENPGKSMREKASEILELLGLSDKMNDNYLVLSEGQKQLVLLARALVCDGTLLVMDEPENALDFNARHMVMKKIRKWLANEMRAGLVILHDTGLALNYCDKILLLNNKKIVEIIDVKNDTINIMESKLSKIYGDISLAKLKGKDGRENFVMLYNSEDL